MHEVVTSAAPEPDRAFELAGPRPVVCRTETLDLLAPARQAIEVPFAVALPAAEFLPRRQVAKAVSEAARPALTLPRPAAGEPRLRQQLARRLDATGWAISADEFTVTEGCRAALTLALRATTQPGDVIAIESPTYFGLLQIAQTLGLQVIEIPCDAQDGMRLDALARAIARWPIKACVVTANFNNPLGCLMPVERKRALLAMLDAAAIPLIEDDIYGDLGFEHQRPPPCATLLPGADVLYCSSVSKTLASGLRVGWIAAGRRHEDVARLASADATLEASPVAQIAVATLLETGAYARYLRTVRPRYAAAVARLRDALARHFPAGTRVSEPAGGFVVWVELPGDIDALRLAGRARERGISVAPGPVFSASGRFGNCLRLSCACAWKVQTVRALATLGRLMRDCGR